MHRKVDCGFIEGELGRSLRGKADCHGLAYYLMTCRHNVKGLGLFRLPIGYVDVDLGYGIDRLSIAYRSLIDLRFCTYDEEHEAVFVVESSRHEWGERPNINSKTVQGMAKTLAEQFDSCRKSSVIRDYVERYRGGWGEIFALFPSLNDRASIAYRSVIDLRSVLIPPDQDQESGSGCRNPEQEDSCAPGGARVSVDQQFESIWAEYPKKIGKAKARAIWNRLGKDRPIPSDVLDVIEAARKSESWLKDDGKYIPHGSTFFSQKRWEDGVEAYPAAKPGWETRNGRRQGIVVDPADEATQELRRRRASGDDDRDWSKPKPADVPVNEMFE